MSSERQAFHFVESVRGAHIFNEVCIFFFFKREKQDSTMRNPSAIIRFDKQCAHLAHCCCCPRIFLSFTLTFRRCIVMLHCCLLAFLQQLSLSPAHPPPSSLFPPTPSKSPFLFESNSTSGGEKSPPNRFCSLRQNRFQASWGTM